MKKSFSLLVALGTILVSCTFFNKTKNRVSDEAIVIYNAKIIDIQSGTISENRAILIDSGVIKTIAPATELREMVARENQIDAKNKYIIPGLWDMHIHLEGSDLIEDNKALLPVYIAYGITTVRDAASDLGEQVLTWRNEINEEMLLGPQIFTAGRKLEGINSIWKGDLEIANGEDLHQMLDTLEGYKVDFVKITENTLSGELFLASVLAAKERGFLVSGHVPYDLTIQQLADAGFSSIEHASYVLRLGSDEQKYVDRIRSGERAKSEANEDYFIHFDQRRATAAYKELAKTNISVTPTLIGGKQLAYLDVDDHKNDDFLKYLTRRFTANYQWRIDRMAGDTPEQTQRRKDRYLLIANQLPYLRNAGINIMAGSDSAALNTFVYPALALHEELVLFREAGLTPIQILQSATINGAKFMGVEDTLGSIAEGKQADIVILNTNPLNDIRSTQDIYAVINNGTLFDRKALDEILEQARQRRMDLDKSRDKEN